MRKRCSLLFAIILTMIFSGCSMEHTDFGYYEAFSINTSDVQASSPQELEALGIEPSSISVFLSEDGTGTFTFLGDQTPISWIDGRLMMDGEYVQGDYLTYALSDGKLTISTGDGEICFERKSDTPS